jgi:hypothetical protein
MGADITAFLQIDDNTPSDQAPFTNDPSTWDLSGDHGLFGCKDYCFFAAIAGISNSTGISPLFPPRGLPSNVNEHDPINVLREHDDSAVGWLTLSEIDAALTHMSVDRTLVSPHVTRVLEWQPSNGSTAETEYG